MISSAAPGVVGAPAASWQLLHLDAKRAAPSAEQWHHRPLLVVVKRTSEFRRVLRSHAKRAPPPQEAIFEIGCSYGECSRLLVAAGASVVGVDNSFECIDHCRGLALECARFERVDVLGDRAGLASLLASERPGVVAIDIGGNRPLPDVIEVVDAVIGILDDLTATRGRGGSGSGAGDGDGHGDEEEDGRTSSSSPLPPPLVVLKSESLVAELEARRRERARAREKEEEGGGGGGGVVAAAGGGGAARAAAVRVAPARLRRRRRLVGGDGRRLRERSDGLRTDKLAGIDTRLRLPNWYPQRSVRAEGGEEVTICRFHNYDARRGCSKGRSGNCPFDHATATFACSPGMLRTVPRVAATLALAEVAEVVLILSAPCAFCSASASERPVEHPEAGGPSAAERSEAAHSVRRESGVRNPV